MLRNCTILLKNGGLKSHQVTGASYAFKKNRFGYYYGYNQIRVGNGGWGMSTYSPRKKHSPKIRPITSNANGCSTVLSGHWRSYALADGGVLFTHPSHKQLMQWSHAVEEKEAEASGITAVSENNKAKIQSIIVDNTLENHALSSWRRKHLWNLVRAKTEVGLKDGFNSPAASLYSSVRSGANLRKNPLSVNH